MYSYGYSYAAHSVSGPSAEPPVNTGAPVILDDNSDTPSPPTAPVGSPLRLDPGTWEPAPDSFTYRIYVDDVLVQEDGSGAYSTASGITGQIITGEVLANWSGGVTEPVAASNSVELTDPV